MLVAAMFYPSILSILACSSILLTYWQFYDIVAKKSFMVCIFYVTVSIIFSNVGSAIGYPPAGSAACWMQGIFTKYFVIAAMLWMTIITFMMHHLVETNKIFAINWKHHLLSWGLPAIITFVPLIHTTIGPVESYGGWCWMKEQESSPSWAMFLYLWVFDMLPVVTCMVLMLAILIRLKLKMFRMEEGHTKKCLEVVLVSMQFIPVIVLAYFIITFVLYQFVQDNTIYCLRGLVCTLHFWYSNEDIRLLWVKFFKAFYFTKFVRSMWTSSSFSNCFHRSVRPCEDDRDLSIPDQGFLIFEGNFLSNYLSSVHSNAPIQVLGPNNSLASLGSETNTFSMKPGKFSALPGGMVESKLNLKPSVGPFFVLPMSTGSSLLKVAPSQHADFNATVDGGDLDPKDSSSSTASGGPKINVREHQTELSVLVDSSSRTRVTVTDQTSSRMMKANALAGLDESVPNSCRPDEQV